MKTTSMIWVVVLILLALGAGWYFWTHSSSAPLPTTDTQIPDTTAVATTTTATSTAATTTTAGPATSATIMYDGNTFKPATVTIAKGGTITWIDTAGDMWLASDPHPVHNGYDNTTRAQHCAAGYTGAKPFDECAKGNSFTFTLNQVGSWGYHDHFNDSAQGTVIVQ